MNNTKSTYELNKNKPYKTFIISSPKGHCYFFKKNLKSHENWHNNAIIFQIRANSNLKSNKNKSKSFSGEKIMRSWLSQHSL